MAGFYKQEYLKLESMMKFNISNGVHYSKYCGVRHSALRNKGVFDGTIDNDSLLHIDPMLLKNSSIPEFNNAYTISTISNDL